MNQRWTRDPKWGNQPADNNRMMERARARARRNEVEAPMESQVVVAIAFSLIVIAVSLAILSVVGEVVVGMN